MKKILLLFLLFVTCSQLISAQGIENGSSQSLKSLFKIWKLDYSKYGITEKKLPNDAWHMLEFNQKNILYFIAKNGKREIGRWQYDKKTKSIKIFQGKEFLHRIENLPVNHRLIIVTQQSGGTDPPSTVGKKIYFNEVKK